MAKILVAENDKYLVNIYRLKLTKAGFEVQITRDGQQALDALKTFKPDLILLDLMMPVVDGFAFLEEVKKDQNLSKIPVIIASNLGQKEDISRGMALGAKDYIVKSDLSLIDLIAKINKVIGES
jgi:DNA-binding response OmpR family regulator